MEIVFVFFFQPAIDFGLHGHLLMVRTNQNRTENKCKSNITKQHYCLVLSDSTAEHFYSRNRQEDITYLIEQ